MKNNLFKRFMSLLVCFAILAACLPVFALDAAAASNGLNIIEGSKKADPDTTDGWTKYFGPSKMDTEFAGAVWTDKSVFSAATDSLPGVTLADSKNFLVSLSAIASNMSITGHTSAPTDTMLVLDMSGSMVDDTYEVGTIRWGNNYQTVNGIDMSLIEAMIDATNATIDKLMKQNTNNRIGVVLYSGNTDADDAATPQTATVVLPLGRYTGISGEYLSVDTTWRTDALYEYNYRSRRWQATGDTATYVPSNTAVNVSVKDGLKTEGGGDVEDLSKRAQGGTYIQNGLYQAMNEFLKDSIDTVVPEGKPQAGAERMPVIVLMSDGAPTIATASYNNIGNSHIGTGQNTTDRITFMTQLTAAYVRSRVAAKYQENENDEKEVLFLTLGLGTENSAAATDTLYPAGSNDTLTGYWDSFLAGTGGSNVQIVSGNDGWSVYRDAAVEKMNYVDKYFYASNAQGLLDSFNDILSEIQLKAESYATLVEGSSADFSGYVTFEDELGEMMQVSAVKGILMDNGQGSTVLYTGKGVAQGMTNGNLGTVDGPTERGDELVRTVKERIPGTSTTQAQQLINSAYLDQQLYYTDDANWSNYIGWYADANGNYVGFWDKDSGYENAPAGAVYANRSYGYLGVNGDSDMMHVVVMVRTNLTTLHQTVLFKIPASLLPIVQYNITLAEDDPSSVETFQQKTAVPMRLVFEVGLREDINSVNLEQKIAEHIAKGGHVHRNNDGTVTFYTNEWAIGNDTNGNGIPDPEEVENAAVAESHFHPAMDNSRFYYVGDTVIYDDNGDPATGTARPSGTGYHYDRYIYSASGRQVIKTPISAVTLEKDATYDDQNGYWYIPAGTMYRNFARFRTPKAPDNTTGTLDYSFYPAVFENGAKQDVYSFLGNNGSFTVAPATGFTLTKQVDGTIDNVQDYTFLVTLSGDAEPVLTDADGNPMSGMSAYNNGSFTVTLPVGVTGYISGIPVGTAVEIAEQINGDYHVSKILTAGADQTAGGVASFTVPAYVKDSTQMVPVEFTNAPNQYGDLVISKDVHHTLESDPEALATKIFTFNVTLTGNKITAGNTFETSTGAKVVVAQDGTITFEDGSAITLKNEESITIYGLPEGSSYTVEETLIPEGFELTSINNEAVNITQGQIAGNETKQAHFINAYPDEFQPVTLDLNLTINKILEGNPPKAETFRFALQKLLADNSHPDIKVFTISSDDANKVATDTLTLDFDNVGTYFYRIVEKLPDDPTAGMTYSTTQALFAVIVTDNDMDGKLEIAVRQEAHITDAFVTYTDAQDHETATDINVETEFTNIYKVHSTQVEVPVHKDLVNHTGVDIPLTEFRFGIYNVDAQGEATGDPIQTVTANALGDAIFNLVIEEDKDLTYIIKEIVPSPARVGMTYDPAEYILTITVNADAAGQLSATTSIVLKGAEAEGEKAPVFENTYKLDPASSSIPVSKTLVGRPVKNEDSFAFYLVRTDDTYKPLEGNGAYNATYYWSTGDFSIPLGYDRNSDTYLLNKAGTYHYKLTEIAGSEGGMLYDPAEYHIAITVSDNGNGKLVASDPVIHKVGQAGSVNAAAFVNTYTVTGEGQVVLSGEKVIIDNNGNPSDRLLAAGEFTFGLYADSAFTQLIETVTNRADGTFSFSPITYTPADLGEGNAEKTYEYYIKELDDGKLGFTYDNSFYAVPVTVSHKDGVLTVTPARGHNALRFENVYEADPVTVTLSGSKALSGNWDAVANKDFTFNLFAADASFAITDSTPVQTATVTGADDFSITLNYADGQEGTHYYVLKEQIPDPKAGGIGYDAGEYHITVNISDPGDGKLAATKTVYRPGTGNVDATNFTNAYTVAPATVTLVGNKSFNKTMQDNDFSFFVLEVEDPTEADLSKSTLVTIGHNLANGTISFPQIEYTTAGVHYYKILEVPGEIGYIDYDDTVFDLTVTVTDNGEGKLIPTVTTAFNGAVITEEQDNECAITVSGLAFQNTYTPGAAQVTIKGIKTFDGDWSNVPAANKVFTFALFPADDQFHITGNALETRNVDGEFEFTALSYSVEDTYYYVLKEIAGASNIGIDYASYEIHITVEVDDNSNGKLIPTVTTDFSGATVTTDQNDASIVTLSGLEFINTYAAEGVPYKLKATKIYEGDQMKTFDFELKNEDGIFATQLKQNDTSGNVAFDEIFFTQAGTYRFKVSEKENILWGFIKWDVNVYSVTVEVTDNGTGKLVLGNITVTSIRGRDDLVFRNVHEDLILKKDVFAENDLNVSIDGKKVQPDDVLTYTLTYTNYTGLTVDEVVITDIIPNHTSYVEGSASNGGVFDGSKLTWTFRNVPADAVVPVSFQVKVAGAGVTVQNKGEVLEGTNTYLSNEITNPVDKIEKDVFHISDTSLSIDNKEVELNDILLYKITYTNADDVPAQVTITDIIPRYTSYVEGSADKGGTFDGTKLTWVLNLAAGESETVTFQVKVTETRITVVNQASGVSDGNTYETNVVRNPVDEDIVTKDAFADARLSISIDGKKVEKGDILYYTITYTNADDIAGTVTVTDTIPQYTSYVEGSADNGGTYADGKLTWTLNLAAGESKTVSFQVKVTAAGAVVTNQAQAVEGENILTTNTVTNTVVTDTVEKDVFYANAPTVSIDGKEVPNGSILLYKVTYQNNDDAPAQVTITDAIPQYTSYVEGSATENGAYADGKLTWVLDLAAGESKTVSFQVKVTQEGVTIINKANAVEGENKLETNQVTNTVPVPQTTPTPTPTTPSDNPHTGDNTNVALLGAIMLFSLACLFVLVLSRKREAN